MVTVKLVSDICGHTEV